MAEVREAPGVGDCLKAAGFMLATPHDGLKGYIVIGVTADDSYLVSGNLPTTLHLIGVLGEVIRDLAAEMSDSIRVITPE